MTRGATGRKPGRPGLTVAVTTPEAFDLIIIGTGSGNAIPDHLAGWRIAIVERDVFGGTCINRGCIPSKMFVLPADAALGARQSAKLGIDTQFNGADWPAIRDRIFGRIDAIAVSGREYRAHGSPDITLIEGTARFTDSHTLDVDGRSITAPKILVAAGARPEVPPIAGLNETGFHTSDTVMRLPALPRRLGIIGGGFIAAEMGHVFDALGSEVTLVTRSSTMLSSFDADVAARFTEVFGRRVTLHLGHIPDHVYRRDDGMVVRCDADEFVVDELLVATGRRPNTDLLDVAAAGLACRPDGTIAVDDTMATNVEGIWAIGDIANGHQLKHVANAEARVAFWNLANPSALRRQRYHAVPSAVFSNPQVATVGMTEREAAATGRRVRVGRRDYGATAYGWALVDDTSFAKVLVDAESGLVVGAHVVGPQASSIIQPLVQAMALGTPAERVARDVFYIHPALTEVVENALLDALDQ